MSWLRVFGSRIRGLFGKSRLDEDLEEELRSHIEMLVEENLRRGMSPEDARCAARRSFGGVLQTTEAYREQRGLPIVETFMQVIRYGFRMLRKNPSFTSVAVLTLALGIGANTAIFSALDAVMLKVLPIRDPQQLLLVSWTSKDWPAVVEDLVGSNRKDAASGGWLSESVPYPVFDALRTRSTTCSEVFAFSANINKEIGLRTSPFHYPRMKRACRAKKSAFDRDFLIACITNWSKVRMERRRDPQFARRRYM